MLSALLIFPCTAILWLLICDRLGLVEERAPGNDTIFRG